MHLLKPCLALLTFLITSSLLPVVSAHADVRVQNFEWNNQILQVTDHWVRPTNAGQDVGAAYMTLNAQATCELTDVSSNVAGAVEIHNMTMDKGIMKMRRLKTLLLEEGKPVKLAPGGFHLMLFDLKKPLAIGDKVDFSLTLQCGDKKLQPLMMTSTVKSADADMEHHHHHH